jgi:hypothetical protein
MVPPLTPDEAAALHEASLLAVCEHVGRATNLDARLVVTPDDCVDDLADLVGEHVGGAWPQGEGDLGRRLMRATNRAFDEGAVGVLLLGADSPTLPQESLTTAAESLYVHDAVLGPCDDGGNYLLGLRQPFPVLLTGIEWGGPHVADQTRKRADDAAIDLYQLPTWYDLDRFDDLKRAAKDLVRTAHPSRPLADALRRRIEAIIDNHTER